MESFTNKQPVRRLQIKMKETARRFSNPWWILGKLFLQEKNKWVNVKTQLKCFPPLWLTEPIISSIVIINTPQQPHCIVKCYQKEHELSLDIFKAWKMYCRPQEKPKSRKKKCKTHIKTPNMAKQIVVGGVLCCTVGKGENIQEHTHTVEGLG